jgi:hypothetical protein
MIASTPRYLLLPMVIAWIPRPAVAEDNVLGLSQPQNARQRRP